jgi:uncharacterized Zn finger protein
MPWFTEEDLRAAAGDGSFQRARDYVDAVGELRPTALGVRATVRGKDAYEVWLGREKETLVGECECPFGLEGNFCKHCVAVGLAMLVAGDPTPSADLATYLKSLDQQDLVDLLLEQANRDPALYRRLMLRAGTTGTPQVAVLRRQVDEALNVRGYVDKDYAVRAKDIVDTIEALIEAGHAAEARPLARHAAEQLAKAVGAIDDPVGTVAGICRRAVKLYARACTKARTNPAKLAAWLFDLRLAWTTWPTIDITDFADPLGDPGMAEYGRLVEEAWQTSPEEADVTVLKGMREQLARTSGNVNAMIDLLSDGLPSPRAYREIAETLRRASRLPDAIRWAEEGVASTQDVALTELLVDSYLEADRAEEAVSLRKAALREAPTRLCYARLRETATEAKEWQTLRSWALAVLTADPRELVGALLDDEEPEEAWQAAVKYDCVGVEVARHRCMTHPADVVPAYRSLVEKCLTRGGRDAYREAGILLQELTKAATQCGESVAEYVALLKSQNARRPALLDELRRAGF